MNKIIVFGGTDIAPRWKNILSHFLKKLGTTDDFGKSIMETSLSWLLEFPFCVRRQDSMHFGYIIDTTERMSGSCFKADINLAWRK